MSLPAECIMQQELALGNKIRVRGVVEVYNSERGVWCRIPGAPFIEVNSAGLAWQVINLIQAGVKSVKVNYERE